MADPVSFPLDNWTGYYGVVTFSPWAQPPNLTVQPNGSGGFEILFDGVAINNWTYNGVYNQLAWTAAGGNQGSATLTFYTATASSSNSNSYAGACFTGTLSIPSGFVCSGTYSGQLSMPQDLSEWIGAYGVTVLTPPASSANPTVVMGPELDVYLSGGNPAVTINFGKGKTTSVPVTNFNETNNTLVWTGSMPINTTGSVQFGTQSAPTASSSYVGSFFDGTLTLQETVNIFTAQSYTWSGEIGSFYYTNTSLSTLQVVEDVTEKVTLVLARMYLQFKAMELGKEFAQWVYETISEAFSKETADETDLEDEGIEMTEMTTEEDTVFSDVGTPIDFADPPEMIGSAPAEGAAADGAAGADGAAEGADEAGADAGAEAGADADAAGSAAEADAAADAAADVAVDAGADAALDCLWLLFLC